MYGWRARIGLLIPSNNTVIEPELYRMVPEGVSVHGTMMFLEGMGDGAMHTMEAVAERGMRELVGAAVDVIVYACFGTTLAKDRDWATKFREKGERLSNVPCTTASLAMLNALSHLEVQRIAVGAPYPEDLNERLESYFADNGFTVVSHRGLGIDDVHEFCRQPPNVAYELARAVDCPEAEAICLLATDFRTIEVLEPLEHDLGKPVISTNQSILWKALQLTGVHERIQGFGRLLWAD